MNDKPRNTKKLKQLRHDAVGEIEPVSGKMFLILEQESKHGKTDPCPFCGKHHFHGVGDGHRVAHCFYSDVAFTNGLGQTFCNRDGYVIKTKEVMG